ncbi:hypothetical protein SCLCIDRAFT_312757 [Scleroderma citrinum Foug A]|uniref:Uncharacterized protein n=1 Tax=Scleroderma citrinum Foug A TaxID=1036808 RepID=A0A0C2ZRL4_9AGAM|nr:hypothetical protein SCLCIDRAFT_312757 [Scleroderma citrinum Foug A]
MANQSRSVPNGGYYWMMTPNEQPSVVPDRSLFRLSYYWEVRSHSRRRSTEIPGKPLHNSALTCSNGTGFPVGTRFNHSALPLFTPILMSMLLA